MSSLSSFLVVAYAIVIAVFLEGCSTPDAKPDANPDAKPDAKVGDAVANKPAKSAPASGSTLSAMATSTTTTSILFRTPPMAVKEAAKYLNDLYDGFNEKKEKTPLGVTISMAGLPNTFYGNIFCSKVPNPKFPKKYTSCYKGGADCRLSASLYNHKMILNATTGVSLLGLGRSTGFVINDTRVEKEWAKCAYIWDGSTQNKLNMGCGEGAPIETCNTPGTAFENICPSTGKTCTAEDREVQNNICKPYHTRGQHEIPKTLRGYPQCTFPGPAFSHHGQIDYKPYASNLRDMAKARVERNKFKDEEGPNIEKWNEVVIDEQLMLPEIWKDPALVIPAFVYTKSGMPLSKKNAEQMRDEFCKLNNVGKIPIVEIDDVTQKRGGLGKLFGLRGKRQPFKVPEGESESLVEIDATESVMASGAGHRVDGPFTVPSRAAFVEIEGNQNRDGEPSTLLSKVHAGMRKLRGSSGATRFGTDVVGGATSYS